MHSVFEQVRRKRKGSQWCVSVEPYLTTKAPVESAPKMIPQPQSDPILASCFTACRCLFCCLLLLLRILFLVKNRSKQTLRHFWLENPMSKIKQSTQMRNQHQSTRIKVSLQLIAADKTVKSRRVFARDVRGTYISSPPRIQEQSKIFILIRDPLVSRLVFLISAWLPGQSQGKCERSVRRQLERISTSVSAAVLSDCSDEWQLTFWPLQ